MTIDPKRRAKLRSEAQKLDQTVKVGKSGVTPTIVDELKAQVERRGLVKVGLLKSATWEEGKGNIAEELAERTGADLVEVRGNTAVYARRGLR